MHNKLIDSLYKKHFARMVTSLARYVGLRDLAAAEDIVQEAFAEAARKWNAQLPDDPEAWLYRVCRNIALNKLRDTKIFRASIDESSLAYEMQDNSDDHQLLMLLACAHRDFSAKNQVIFALRYVAGLRIEQIAKALGSPADTIAKTLLRMRETIVRQNITFAPDLSTATHEQSLVLHKIIYLMFSEGSKTSGGRSILNLELCEDALGLGLSIVRSKSLVLPESHALVALMLLNLSRFEARFDETGEPVELEHQDRSKWNGEMIRVAVHHISKAGDKASAYHIEAAIAWLHTSAPTFADTDWKKIALLYDRILAINDSPFVRMNQSIALFYAGDVLTSLHQLKKLSESAFMQQHYLLHMALGKVYSAANEPGDARRHFLKAYELSPHEVERKHIKKLYL